MRFKRWFYLNESQKISQYLKDNDFVDEKDYVHSLPVVQYYLNRIAIKHPIPYKVGKVGLWLRGKNYYPVKIVGVEDLSVILEKPDGTSWSEIYNLFPIFNDRGINKQLILPKEKAIIVDEKEYFKFLNWLTYLYVTENPENPNQFFDYLFQRYDKILEKSFENKGSNFTTTDFTLKNLDNLEDIVDKKKAKDSRSNKPGPEGRTIVKFPNGWKWISLDKASCEEEGDAAGHCGNKAGEIAGENILSLRDEDNKIHMTVVVDKYGFTNEMKAPGNKKPESYTHPYIIGLFKNTNYKIGEGKWDTSNDFQLTDLSIKNLIALKKDRPDLVNNISSIKYLAIEANGDQNKFRKLVKEKYNVQDFPYNYDYRERAILIDQISYNSMETKYRLKNIYKQDQDLNIREILYLISNLWDNIPTSTRNAIEKVYDIKGKGADTTEGNYVAEIFYRLTKTDRNLTKQLVNLYNKVYENHMFNLNHYHGSLYSIKFVPGVSVPDVKILLKDEKAEELLENKSPLYLPEYIDDIELPVINSPIQDGEDNLDSWVMPLNHALEVSRFWERPIMSKTGKSWSQSIDDIPGIKDRNQTYANMPKIGESPMKKQVRMEYIRRELGERSMNGKYDEFVEELNKKGWWEEYKKWANENGFSGSYID